MNFQPAQPKDAAAVVLIRDNRVLWARRNPNLAFLGGWHAFPGGKVEASDAAVAVENCDAEDLKTFVAAAAREAFEEIGVLLARNGEKLTKGQRASLHDDLISGRSTFAEILADWNLHVDARDFLYAGFWTTPQFSPVRFKTRFFVVECPPKQTPYAAISEMQSPEFIAPTAALERWANGEVLISPPVLIALQELEKTETNAERENGNEKIVDGTDEKNFSAFYEQFAATNFSAARRRGAANLRSKSEEVNGDIHFIELNPHLIVFPLATETLPPATHTNCFVVGRREFIVIDAAARAESEQAKLFALIDRLIERGAVCRQIVVSHFHADHTGAETVLRERLRRKFGVDVPVAAHEKTVAALDGQIEFQKLVADEEIFVLRDERGAHFELQAFHAPGHAPGHLCFYDRAKGFLLASDNVVGAGSVVIAPPDGDMRAYLESLERMKNLPNLRFLCGSHGAAQTDAARKIEQYIAHRLEREKQISAAVASGARNVREIVERVYVDLAPELVAFAEKSVAAHLAKLEIEL